MILELIVTVFVEEFVAVVALEKSKQTAVIFFWKHCNIFFREIK